MMHPQVQAAVKAHSNGNTNEAERLYIQCLADGLDSSPSLYQNYGALLRAKGDYKKSGKIYDKGLIIFPNNPGILLNYANLLRDQRPTKAISFYLKVIRIRCLQNDDKKLLEVLYSLLTLLSAQGFDAWCLKICIYSLKVLPLSPYILLHLAQISGNVLDSSSKLILLDHLVTLSAELKTIEQSELCFNLASLYLQDQKPELSFHVYRKAMKLLAECYATSEADKLNKVLINHSWNFSNDLLRNQYLTDGWKLFEYGLQAPAPGKQRWQRALAKPFSSTEVALWNGESLASKSILLLDEQAVGDAMQFLTLLPTLLQEAKCVSLLLGDRLIPIYKRSFSQFITDHKLVIYSRSQAIQGKINPAVFDFQSPLGSICQHRFTSSSDYSPLSKVILHSKTRADEFRQKYLSNSNTSVSKLIGISWRGGAQGPRMKKKSVPLELFSQLLDVPGVRFVSLQYGQSKSVVEKWRKSGYDVVHDDEVDSLKDMDTWISQVAACDAVVSVANTTIHGSGGLGIPTMCLLSESPDWRWFTSDDVTRSYWYPSVGILRQKSQSWEDAILRARQWILDGSPFPQGRQFSQDPLQALRI